MGTTTLVYTGGMGSTALEDAVGGLGTTALQHIVCMIKQRGLRAHHSTFWTAVLQSALVVWLGFVKEVRSPMVREPSSSRW